MNLVSKITLIYLLITLMVFAIGRSISYNIFKKEIDDEVKIHLRGQLTGIEHSIQTGVKTDILENEKIKIKLLTDSIPQTEIAFTDTLIWHEYHKRWESAPKLKVIKRINSKLYRITIFDLIVESQDIEQSVQRSLNRMYLILFLAVIALSFLLSRWILAPFYDTLRRIKEFTVDQQLGTSKKRTTTSEFKKLNNFIEQMTEKVMKDYQSLKEFSENASHEMQTPLAIVKGKLDLMMQSDNLDESDLKLLVSSQQSIHKLSKMSQALTLLTKIENQEFANQEKLDLSSLTKKAIYNFEELMALKSLELETDIQSGVNLDMNAMLLDMLLNNLLSNSIKHNIENGRIKISLNATELSISNTGMPSKVPIPQLFDRFKKSNQSSESLGLGLAIVKKISDVSGVKTEYTYENDWHTVKVILPKR